MSKTINSISKSRISSIPNGKVVVSTTSSSGRVSLIRRIHGNPSLIFLHAGSSRNFIIVTLASQENLAVFILLVY